MAARIPLANLQSQSFTVALDGSIFSIRLKTIAPSGLVCDISIDNNQIISGQRVVGGTPLIPYSYLEQGNFIFISSVAGEEPDYTKFNVTQNLYYLFPSEIV